MTLETEWNLVFFHRLAKQIKSTRIENDQYVPLLIHNVNPVSIRRVDLVERRIHTRFDSVSPPFPVVVIHAHFGNSSLR